MTGKRSITLRSKVLPKMIKGIESPRPIIKRRKRVSSGPFCAAAATASLEDFFA
jgi:hypothetical protein